MSRLVAALADSALLLPASALVLVYLAASRLWRVAFAFAAGLALAGGLTLGLKLLFHACGHAITDVEVMSPSGHVSFAVIFYGSLGIMLATGRAPRIQALIAGAILLFLVAVGISRVRTWAHTVPEVLIGYAVGAIALALFWLLYRRAGRPALSPLPLAAGFALALVIVGGAHFSLERQIAGFARHLSSSLDMCSPAPPAWRKRAYSGRT